MYSYDKIYWKSEQSRPLLGLVAQGPSHEPMSPTARVKIETAISVIVDEHFINTVGEMCQKLDVAG